MECEFGFVCDAAEQEGKLHALGIGFDTIYARELPAVIPRMSIVARLRGSVAEAGTKNIVFRIIDIDGENVVPPITQQIPFEVKPGLLSANANIILNLNNVPFGKLGEYAIHVLAQDVELKVIRFSVVEIPQTA